MNIIHVIDSLSIGGAEKLIVDIVPLCNRKGIKTDVLLLNGEKTSFYKELESTKSCNIYSLGNTVYNPLFIFKIIPFLRKYDLVHVHLFPAQYFVVLAKVLSLSKTILVFTEHSTGNKRLNNPKIREIEKWIYKHFKKIICITQEVRMVLKEKLSIEDDKLLIVENGINLEKIDSSFTANRSQFGYNDNDVILVMTAGFREEKDHDTVIKTLSILPQNYKLLLIGDGQRRNVLEGLVESENLHNRVKFLGFRNDVYEITKMCDIAILSSHWEGFGLAAAEAMSCGTPTIASNVDGLAQVVENGGLLFEKGNIADLRCKIESLKNVKFYEEVKVKGVAKAKQYSINHMVEKLINIYKAL